AAWVASRRGSHRQAGRWPSGFTSGWAATGVCHGVFSPAAVRAGNGAAASREPNVQGRSVAGRAEDRDCSAKGLDPVFEADDARAAAGVGAAYAVITDRQDEGAVVALYPQVDDCCLGVLGGVGERLGRGVISSRLDLLVQRRAEIQVELDRHR